jgi:hypothetical protein
MPLRADPTYELIPATIWRELSARRAFGSGKEKARTSAWPLPASLRARWVDVTVAKFQQNEYFDDSISRRSLHLQVAQEKSYQIGYNCDPQEMKD